MAHNHLKIWIYSPGDTALERVLASRIMEHIQAETREEAGLEVLLHGSGTPENYGGTDSGTHLPAEIDLAVFILGQGLGSGPVIDMTVSGDLHQEHEAETLFNDAAQRLSENPSFGILLFHKKSTHSATADAPSTGPGISWKNGEEVDRFCERWVEKLKDIPSPPDYRPFEDPVDFETQFEDAIRFHLQDRVQAAESPTDQLEKRVWENPPYRGLAPFEEDHFAIFQGRTRELDGVLEALRQQLAGDKAFLLILGPEGCGKTSLVRAGLFPLLDRPGVLEDFPPKYRVIMHPGQCQGQDSEMDTFQSLAAALIESKVLAVNDTEQGDTEQLAHIIRDNPGSLASMIREAGKLLLFVDRLEELFLPGGPSFEESQIFIDTLSALAHSGSVLVVCAMRVEYYPHCRRFPELMALKTGSGQYDLPPMPPISLSRAVAKPAELAGLTFEQDLNAQTSVHETLKKEMVSALTGLAREKRGFLLVIGRNRGAKYSLVRDEVVPYLIAPGIVEDVGLWREANWLPLESRGDLFDGLTKALIQPEALPELCADGTSPEELADYLRAGPVIVGPLIKGGLSQAAAAHALGKGLSTQPEAKLVLVVDRMEKLFDQDRVPFDEARKMLDSLVGMANSGRVWILGIIDGDFFQQYKELPELAALLEIPGQYDLLVATEALESMPTLQDEILGQVGNQPDALPLMQFTLAELFRHNDNGMLTYGAYREMGGVFGSLKYRAEAVYQGLSSDEARLSFQQGIQQLIHFGERKGSFLPRGLPKEKLEEVSASMEWIEAFKDAGMLAEFKSPDGKTMIEPMHAAFLEGWPRLTQWLVDLQASSFDSSPGEQKATTSETSAPPDSSIDSPLESPMEETIPEEDEDGYEEDTFSTVGSFGIRQIVMAAVLAVVIFFTGWSLHALKASFFDGPGKPGPTASEPRIGPSLDVNTSMGEQTQAREKAEQERAAGREKQEQVEDRLGDALNQVALFFDEKAEGALTEKAYNEARMYFLQSAARFNPKNKEVELADAKGELLTKPEFPIVLSLPQPGGQGQDIGAMAFSPDGKFLAIGATDHSIHIRDLVKGDEVQVLSGHKGEISSVCFSPDGTMLASGSQDKTVLIWDVKSGEKQKTLEGHKDGITVVRFDTNGKMIASGASDGSIYLWNLEDGKRVATLNRHKKGITDLSFSPDGKLLASGSADKLIMLWTLKPVNLIKYMNGHEETITSVSFSPDGKLLASGSFDHTIRLWDLSTYKEKDVLQGHTDVVTSVDFNKAGALVSGSMDETIRIWDLEIKGETTLIRGQIGGVNHCLFSPDGSLLASTLGNKDVRLWKLNRFKHMADIPPLKEGATCLAYSPDGRLLAIGSADNNIRLYDVLSGRELAVLKGHTGSIYSLCFSLDGGILASGSGDKSIRIWDTAEKKEKSVLEGHAAVVYSIAFSPDGSMLASGSGDKTIRLWDVAAGTEKKVLNGHDFPVLCLAFSPTHMQLASGSSDRTTRLWNVQTGAETAILSGKSADMYGDVKDVCYSPDGSILATANGALTAIGGVIRLWDTKSGQEIAVLQGHKHSVNSIRFSPDGSLLASGSGDKTISLWNPETAAREVILKGHGDSVTNVRFSPKRQVITSVSLDGGVKFWNLSYLHRFADMDGVIREAERKYALEISDIHIRPLVPSRNGDEKPEPQWPTSHPFHWLEAAENGDPEAMEQLALIYDRAGDYETALTWYEKAGQAGSEVAKNRHTDLKNWLEEQK